MKQTDTITIRIALQGSWLADADGRPQHFTFTQAEFEQLLSDWRAGLLPADYILQSGQPFVVRLSTIGAIMILPPEG